MAAVTWATCSPLKALQRPQSTIDVQATKEAEHREKLEELRARIADNKGKLAAADESQHLHKVLAS